MAFGTFIDPASTILSENCLEAQNGQTFLISYLIISTRSANGVAEEDLIHSANTIPQTQADIKLAINYSQQLFLHTLCPRKL